MTLTLRSRLTLVYTAVFGVLLVAIGVASYRVLAYQLDADATATLTELTNGLHGYLRFGRGRPTWSSTRRSRAGRVRRRGDALLPGLRREHRATPRAVRRARDRSGCEFTRAEVRQFREQPQIVDFRTDYGRMRLSNSVVAPGAAKLPAPGGLSARADGSRAGARLSCCSSSACRRACSPRSSIGRWMARRRADAALAARRRDTHHRHQRPRPRGCRSAAPATKSMTWPRRSTTRSGGSSTPSARCVSSARRSRTSFARRWRRCAATSRWRMLQRTRDRARIERACQPTGGDRQAQAADRSDPDTRASRGRRDPARERCRRSRRARGVARRAARAGRPGERYRAAMRQRRTASSCRATRLARAARS